MTSAPLFPYSYENQSTLRLETTTSHYIHKRPIENVENDETKREDDSRLFVDPHGDFVRCHGRPSLGFGGITLGGHLNRSVVFFDQVVLALGRDCGYFQTTWKTLQSKNY